MMKRENFSFGFTENISKFMILERNIRKVRSFCKFCKVSLNIQKIKTKLKIAKA